MDFSLFYFAHDSTGERDPYRLLLDGARFADTHGFTAVWTPERHFHPFGGLYPNPSVTSAALAAVTERVAIRAGSVVAPLHHPLRIAEEWSVVDNLSGGRVGVAFASGWNVDDFALNPANYAHRKKVLTDTVKSVRNLWQGKEVFLPNGSGDEVPVRVYPAPVQAELPIWLTTGGTTETFLAAGELGAGVLTHLVGQDLDVLASRVAAYRDALPADNPGHVTLMLHAYLGADGSEVKSLVRGPMTEYLRGPIELFLKSEDAPEESDLEWVVEQAFERFYADSSLLGTVEENLEVLDRVAAAGVDEVACLIDFGLDAKLVLDGLGRLDELRRRWRG
ncbi:siderophore biosynthesis protein [Lentzea sp. NBRC 105346]|uniref:MupA/Atu3671 family FMN-dependent luciferase-like monooxygenase n=1 Tax=Lentzea sp. NBRC 105346 TaxID=3032205 RepID=UPI0024A1E4E8|nr:MupA/Atu3671 family FMN-dependent luciferase-like monooxygenase [Lentzea sp. NBRC 105346]GLZ27831.1 siderophore biosynthesis protein [Lentzea sp. NBRC 105346]